LAHEKISVGPKDKIEPALDVNIKDKDAITIKRAVNVEVVVDGKDLAILSAEENINSMFQIEGISLNPLDKVMPEKETKLSEGMKIDVIRVEKKTFTDSVSIDFSTIIKNDNSLGNHVRKTLQEGKLGEKKVTTDVVYENGKEVSRTIVNESILSKPVDRIIAQGTLPTIAISRGGEPLAYTKVIKSKSTAYWAVNGVGSTYTSSGKKAVRDPSGYSTIAVDKSVIPHGTRMYVEGYGLAIAADTGSGIVGNIIDVYFNTYNEACNWGVKYVNVYILK
jgi:uncharacterized protein YabE (DUF348 family)